MDYLEEFPDFPPGTMPAIPAGWKDMSWHNDACPSFETPNGFHVYVDFADASKREFPENQRFTVLRTTPGGPEFVMASDDWEVILAAVA